MPVSFFIIESNKRLCEKCAVNDIYQKNESYDKIVEKVWNKVKNIMNMRQRIAFQLQRQQTDPSHASALAKAQLNMPGIVQPAMPGGVQESTQEKNKRATRELRLTVDRLNLFYDLLQIEIEKLRRKSIEDILNSETEKLLKNRQTI